MKSIVIFCLFIVQCFIFLSCGTFEPEFSDGIEIQTVDVSPTEIRFKLTARSSLIPCDVELVRNNDKILNFRLYSTDTLIQFDSLSPHTVYTFRASAASGKIMIRPVSVTTMDTTSHGFTWRRFNIDLGGSCSLYGVEVISENDIWASGYISTCDSGGGNYRHYGLMHWDGAEWKCVELRVLNQGDYYTALSAMRILAFGKDDIWFCGNIPVHYDGKNVTPYWIISEPGYPDAPLSEKQTLNAIWGTSSQNLYGTGNKGAIVHFDGNSWKKIESGTTLDIQDVSGYVDPETGKETVVCVASDVFLDRGREIIIIRDMKAEKMTTQGLPYCLESIWIDRKYTVHVAGDGIFKNSLAVPGRWKQYSPDPTDFCSYRIQGNAVNDIVVAGSCCDLLHFNGNTWFDYRNYHSEEPPGNLYDISIKGNVACAVGGDAHRGIIYIGKR